MRLSKQKNDRIKLAIYGDLSHLGGDPLVLLQLTKQLSQKGFRITLAGPISKEILACADFSSWIHRLIPLNGQIYPQKIIHEQLMKDPPDAFLNSGPSPILIETAMRFKKPLFWRIIGHPKWWSHFFGRMDHNAQQIIRAAGHCSERIIAVSDFLRAPFVQEGFQNTETIYEGCNTDYFHPHADERLRFRKEFDLSEKDLAIGIVAHFAWQKRHEIAVRALSHLKKKSHAAKYFFIGGHFGRKMRNERGRLKGLIKKLGVLDKIIFTGVRNDIRRVINGLDILLFPFLDEGFGMSLVEAMACEKPVLVNDSGAFPELVQHGKEGIMVPAENPLAFASGLDFLIQNPARRIALGKMGRVKVIRNFSLKRQIENYERFFKRYLNRI